MRWSFLRLAVCPTLASELNSHGTRLRAEEAMKLTLVQTTLNGTLEQDSLAPVDCLPSHAVPKLIVGHCIQEVFEQSFDLVPYLT